MILLVILLSALGAIALVPLVRRLAFALGAVDYPAGRRKIHSGAVARLGGIAVFVPVALTALAANWLLPETKGRIEMWEFLALVGGSSVIFLLGLYDDIRGANAPTKFAVEFLVAGVAYGAGLAVTQGSTPFGWTVQLGALGFVVTALWLVGMMNGMNLLDGVDGLAAGVGAIGALTLLVVSYVGDKLEVAILAAALLGSLLGFLVFNFHPASIFLGDCGALFIGFFLAAISISGGQKGTAAVALVVPIIALGIPIFDTALAVIRRILRGKHPFQSDRDHLHHRLLAMGFSQRKVALTLYAFSAALAFMAVLMTNVGRMGALLVLLCVGALTVVGIRRLGVAEIWELVGLFQHGERRRKPPRYRSLMVRNTLPLLQRCETLADLRAHLEGLRDVLDVTTLRVRFADKVLGVPSYAASDIFLADGEQPWDASHEADWSCSIDVFCEPQGNGRRGRAGECVAHEACRIANGECVMGRGRLVGEVSATKPGWKRRRQSENDEELLTLLADGIGRWVAAHLSARVLSRPRVLVADDDPQMRRLLEAVLRDSYEVLQAGDAPEAIARAREALPDLVLLDLKMPRVDGFSVCQALKGDPRSQRTPIIMLTTIGDTAGMGADAYITKPFDVDELKARVQMVLRANAECGMRNG